MRMPVSRLIEEMDEDEIELYRCYNDIKPIDTTDYYHAITESTRHAVAGVKGVKLSDHYRDWFGDYLREQDERFIAQRIAADKAVMIKFVGDFNRANKNNKPIRRSKSQTEALMKQVQQGLDSIK